MPPQKFIGTIPKWIFLSFLFFSLFGMADAGYLTWQHYNASQGCFNIVNIGNCETVTASSYSIIGNIPVALLGLLYYLLVFSLAIVYFQLARNSNSENKEIILDFASRFTIVGFLASVWFVYLQLFIIKEICFYCMVSAFISTVLFFLGLAVIWLKTRYSAGVEEKAN